MKNRYYTYVYLDPRRPGRFTYGNFVSFLFEPFYVGKGTGNRKFRHIATAVSKTLEYERHRIIVELLNEGYDVKSYVMDLNTGTSEWAALYCHEPFFIKTIGRLDLGMGPLTNSTDGGDGTVGNILSDESRKKMSDKRKGKEPWNKGKKIGSSEAQRQHLKTLNESRIGVSRSEEVRKKISSKMNGKGHPQTEETRRKISTSLRRQAAC